MLDRLLVHVMVGICWQKMENRAEVGALKIVLQHCAFAKFRCKITVKTIGDFSVCFTGSLKALLIILMEIGRDSAEKKRFLNPGFVPAE